MVGLGGRLSPVAAMCVAPLLMETGSPPLPHAVGINFPLLCAVPWLGDQLLQKGGGSLVLVHKAEDGDPLLTPFSTVSAGTAGCRSTTTTTTFTCGS